MSLTIFDFLKSLTQKKYLEFEKLDEQDRKGYNIFMLNRYISMDNRFIHAVNQIDKYCFNVFTKQMHYDFLFNILPKEFVFFNYIKKEKEDKESLNKKDIKLISQHFSINESQAEIYLNFLDDNDIKNLKKIYGMNKEKNI